MLLYIYMHYQKSITKEEINTLPTFKYTGKIQLITSSLSAKKALKHLAKEKILGFDTETRPSFLKGEHHAVSLLQLSTQNCVFLFRLNKFPFPKELAELLSNENIIKAGVAVRDDIKALQKLYPFKASGFIDLAVEAKQQKIKNFGLGALTAIFLKQRLSKRAKISNWEKETLTNEQLLYAASDAWVGLQIYFKLTS